MIGTAVKMLTSSEQWPTGFGPREIEAILTARKGHAVLPDGSVTRAVDVG